MADNTSKCWNTYLGGINFEINHIYNKYIDSTPHKYILSHGQVNAKNPYHNVSVNNHWNDNIAGFQIYNANTRCLKIKSTANTNQPPMFTGPYRIVSLGNTPLIYILRHEGLRKGEDKLVKAHHSQICAIQPKVNEVLERNKQYRTMWKKYKLTDSSNIYLDSSVGIIGSSKFYPPLTINHIHKLNPSSNTDKLNIDGGSELLLDQCTPTYEDYVDEDSNGYLVKGSNDCASEMINRVYYVSQPTDKQQVRYSPFWANHSNSKKLIDEPIYESFIPDYVSPACPYENPLMKFRNKSFSYVPNHNDFSCRSPWTKEIKKHHNKKEPASTITAPQPSKLEEHNVLKEREILLSSGEIKNQIICDQSDNELVVNETTTPSISDLDISDASTEKSGHKYALRSGGPVNVDPSVYMVK